MKQKLTKLNRETVNVTIILEDFNMSLAIMNSEIEDQQGSKFDNSIDQ